MANKARRPEGSPSSTSALPELTYATFAHVMKNFQEVMNVAIMTSTEGVQTEFEAKFSAGDLRSVRFEDKEYHIRDVELWRRVGTENSAQYMSAIGVSSSSDHMLLYDDNDTRGPRWFLKYETVRWLDDDRP